MMKFNLEEVLAERIQYAIRLGELADAVADIGEGMQPIKRAMMAIAQREASLTQEAETFSWEAFHALPEATQELLRQLVGRKHQDWEQSSGFWKGCKDAWIVVVGSFNNPEIVARGDSLTSWPSTDAFEALAVQHQGRMVWGIDRP